MRQRRQLTQGFTKWKLNELPTGHEHINFPSSRARRIWNYVLGIGKAEWPRGCHHGHPTPSGHPHEDEGYLLHFVLGGELWHRVDNQVHVARKHDAVFLDLSTTVEYGNSSKQPARFYWVSFNGKQMPEVFVELSAGRNPLFRELEWGRMTAIFRTLIRVIACEPRAYEAEASVLLMGLLAKLFAVRAPQAISFEGDKDLYRASEPVRNAVHYLIHRYSEPWSVKQLSEKVGLSMYHFGRTFRRETGYSPIQFLNRYRIEQAKALLAETGRPVEQIARQIGVMDPKYFARLFRHLSGLGPRSYRNQARAKHSSWNKHPRRMKLNIPAR